MIELENLKAVHGEFELFVKEAFFKENQITGILGLNGSGKSTLLKTIIGMNEWEGNILYDKINLRSISSKERAAFVSYLPQKVLDVNMSVYTLVSHGRFPYLGFSKTLGKRDKELIENALSLTDLAQKKHKNVMELSGGEKQRAYLAMIIAQDTKMILLDEFTSYLDIEHQIDFFEVLKNLSSQGRGIVICSHDIPQALSFCDEIILLKNGKVIDSGSAKKIGEGKSLEEALGVKVEKSLQENSLYKYNLSGLCK